MAHLSPEESISTDATEAQLMLPDVGLRSPAPQATTSDLPVDLVDKSAQRIGVLAATVAVVAVIEAVSSHAFAYLRNPNYPQRADQLDLIGVAIMIAIS